MGFGGVAGSRIGTFCCLRPTHTQVRYMFSRSPGLHTSRPSLLSAYSKNKLWKNSWQTCIRKMSSGKSEFDLSWLLACSIELVRRSNTIISGIYESGDLDVIDKALGKEGGSEKKSAVEEVIDPTTKADLTAQKLIAGSLRELFPNISICGEEGSLEYTADEIVSLSTLQESGVVPLTKLNEGVDDFSKAELNGPNFKGHALLRKQFVVSESKNTQGSVFNDSLSWNPSDINVWIDPLDGTKEFTEGIKSAVTTLVGIAYQGRPVASVIGRPFTKDDDGKPSIFWSTVGLGFYAALPPSMMSDDLSKVAALKARYLEGICYDNTKNDKRRVICTSRSHFAPSMRSYIVACEPSGFVRSGGCGGKVLMIVEGIADAYVFPSLGTKKWDTCAVESVILTLGGQLTKPDGTLYDYSKNEKSEYMNNEGFVVTCKPHLNAQGCLRVSNYFDNPSNDNDEELKQADPADEIGYHQSYLLSNLGNVNAACLDIVLFGCTGYTGKMALLWLLTRYGNNTNFRFGIAARNIEKLNNILKEIREECTSDGVYNSYGYRFESLSLDRLRLIKCNAISEEECESMVRQTSVMMTTVGPFDRYGEMIVKACVKYGVDYCDTTGEFWWVKKMSLKYECEAIRSHARIVPQTAFVSFPIDTSIYKGIKEYFKDNDKATDSLRTRTIYKMKGSQSGGTLYSTINGLRSKETPSVDPSRDFLYMVNEKPMVSREYDRNGCGGTLPGRTLAYNSKVRMTQPMPSIMPKWNEELRGYEAPHWYGYVDRLVVGHSYYRNSKFEMYGKNFEMDYPVLLLPTLPAVIVYVSLVAFIGICNGSKFGKVILGYAISLLLWLDKVGVLSLPKPGEGQTLENAMKGFGNVHTLIENTTTKEACEVVLKMNGGPGYYVTSRMMVENALFMARQRKGEFGRMKFKGGFLTPSSAFGAQVLDEMCKYEPSYMSVEVKPVTQ